jgi:protein tyrosine phosphatase (PTP) superfamily phosphohydrolase (DUF442 family)
MVRPGQVDVFWGEGPLVGAAEQKQRFGEIDRSVLTACRRSTRAAAVLTVQVPVAAMRVASVMRVRA